MKEKFIHSELHLIAADISKYCGEPKKFHTYLGIVIRIGKQRAYQIMSEMKQDDWKIKSRAKLFMWKAKNLST